jgi:hypothetical protein
LILPEMDSERADDKWADIEAGLVEINIDNLTIKLTKHSFFLSVSTSLSSVATITSLYGEQFWENLR